MLKARAETIQGEYLHLEAAIPAREERIGALETLLADIRRELELVRERLAARTGDFLEAALLDRDIAAAGERFLKTVSRLEAITREQANTLHKRSEHEEKERGLNGRIQSLLQWIEAHEGDEILAAKIPDMESLLTQIIAIRQELEKCRNLRGDALKAEKRAAKAFRHSEAAVQKARRKAELLKDRKTDRDGRLLAVFEGETKDSLNAGIDHRIKKLAACKSLIRIGRKAKKDGAFRNVRAELVENQSLIADLTQSISVERLRLQELEGRIRQRDTIRRFDPDRGLLQQGEPCPLCGASAHPFLDNGGIDFTELDSIVRNREEKIQAQQIELDSFQAKDISLQARVTAMEKVRQEWVSACGVAGEAWNFGDTNPPSEGIRTIRKEIRSARSRLRSAWWSVWRVKWTDRSLGRKLEKLSKREKVLKLTRDEHETRQKALTKIDNDLNHLGENESSIRLELSVHLQHWREHLPEPGSEKLPVERLRERSENYRLKRLERMMAEDELQLLQTQRGAFSEVLQRLEDEMQSLSVESEAIQTLLNALKADRNARYGDMDPAHERRTLESEVEDFNAKEQSLTTEADTLRQGLAADREVLQRLRDQMLQTRNEADAAELDILERSSAAGFGSLS
ncbi:MAG: hypothetical protein JZU63_04935, partial [Rhodoferax sp.]|nr:hypothetical protein [Rhodoferax sp.]